MSSEPIEGLVRVASSRGFDATVDRIKELLAARGLQLFALVDHSGEARRVGMAMLPTNLLIFGNPKGGTPAMNAAPTLAIDLPLKLLISEDGQGAVWIAYNSPSYLAGRHRLAPDLQRSLEIAGTIADEARA